MMMEIAETKIGKIRWRLPAVLLVSVVISYLDRNNLSFALPKIALEYGWTNAETGKYGMMLFLAFFFSYGLANMLFSPFGEKIGPRKTIIAAVTCFSIFTIMGGLAGKIFSLFLITRVLLGLGEGVHFPMNSKLIKNWFPVNERSRANGLWISGVMVSVILAPVLLVPVIEWFGWRTMFFVLGLAGMFVTIPLILIFVRNTPAEAPEVSPAEAEFIAKGMELETDSQGGYWTEMAPVYRNSAFWLVMAGGVLNNAASYGLMQWLPTYFVEGRGMEFKDLWWATSLPYMLGLTGIIAASWLGDKTERRALVAGVGYIITAVVAYFAATSPSMTMTIALLSVAVFFQMSYTSQEFAILQRIIPKNRIGTGTGFYNGLAMMVGGIAGHSIVGGVVSATGNYTYGIVALLSTALLCGIVMLVLSRVLKY